MRVCTNSNSRKCPVARYDTRTSEVHLGGLGPCHTHRECCSCIVVEETRRERKAGHRVHAQLLGPFAVRSRWALLSHLSKEACATRADDLLPFIGAYLGFANEYAVVQVFRDAFRLASLPSGSEAWIRRYGRVHRAAQMAAFLRKDVAENPRPTGMPHRVIPATLQAQYQPMATPSRRMVCSPLHNLLDGVYS